MKKNLTILLFLTFTACRDSEKSAIEIVKFDSSEIHLLRQNSDSIIRLPDNDISVVYQDNYFLKDSSVFWVWTDKKSGIVRGTKRIKNGITYNWLEYHATTGQLIGQSETDYIDSYDNRHKDGIVKWYYEDGRIKLLGKYRNNIRVGDWKYYDTQGNLDSIESYDNEGNINRK
jgi:hypothetical protein